jgi:aquaporin Z
MIRKLVAEFIGTAILVIVAVGTATVMFGHWRIAIFPGGSGASLAAGIVATALAFGLVLVALVYAIGPISGCHINPAVTIGFVVSGRMPVMEALSYWVAQFAGAIAGAYAIWGIFRGSPAYVVNATPLHQATGLGTDGYGSASFTHLSASSAFAVEAVLTFIFVMVVLFATSKVALEKFAGLAIGLGLTMVHLIGIALTGTSVNPARSLGPAIVVGGTALSQVWLFIVAPLCGGFIAALAYSVLIKNDAVDVPSDVVPADQGI